MPGSFITAFARLFQSRPSGATLDVGAGSMPATTQPKSPDLTHVQGLIGKVTELTSAVVQDVGSHNATIQAISTELTRVPSRRLFANCSSRIRNCKVASNGPKKRCSTIRINCKMQLLAPARTA
jgi:hypothetical protein